MERNRWLTLTLPATWGAFIAAWLAFTPTLMPRAPWLQGVVAGVSAAIGYGLLLLVAWLWREIREREPRTPHRYAWTALWVVGPVGYLLAVVVGARSQWGLADELGIERGGWWGVLLVTPVVTVAIFTILLVVARGLRWVGRALTDLLDRWTSRRVARAVSLLVVALAVIGVASGVLWRTAINTLDRSFALADRLTPEQVSQPGSPLRSGSDDSLVAWDGLGVEGRKFVARGPDAAEITEVTGLASEEPIRVFAGMDNEADVEERARLAVDDLVRAGGLERSAILVATTTGTGWVEPSSAASFEFLTAGDSAIVSMQYSYLPSPLSFLVDQTRARVAGRQLFDEVYARVLELPEDERPRLYAFGESLGSFGGETAFSGEFDMANRLDGALFVGPPSFNPLYREFVDTRDEGSREVEPVYRGGRTVRFVNRVGGSEPPGTVPWGETRVLYLQHASDPITWWHPDLILQRPDWLEEERGPDVPEASRWVPFVTFWQVSADMLLGFDSPPGTGHNYSGDHALGWAQVLDSELDPETVESVRQVVLERHAEDL
ncbi:MAG: alpha/beta hydrolase [Nocardioides sp.]|uniref:alpha/beta hydrolase n=1 Tax=Nocardioides sp. TaxID=35761 RepID=UPI003F12588C